jgi:predicted enzyme related to lactoylglutathione lyase
MLKFEKLVPIIYVKDLDAEVKFYQTLGFSISYQGDEFPNFIAVAQDELEFGIQKKDMFDANEANRSLLWQFQVNDLMEAVTLCQQHHYRHSVPEKYWEAADGWEMQVWSPNGYKINLEGHAPGKRD